MELLTIYCFVLLLKMKPWGSFQVNEATNVVFMILCGSFISEIVLNLSFRWVKKILVKSVSMFTLAGEQVLHVLNDKFSLVKKHRSSNQRPWTMIFHRVKFHRSWCRLAIANSERLLRTSILMNKSLYSYNKLSLPCPNSSRRIIRLNRANINIFSRNLVARARDPLGGNRRALRKGREEPAFDWLFDN